jgi:hypothetical protein
MLPEPTYPFNLICVVTAEMEVTHHDSRAKDDSVFPLVIRGLQRILAKPLLRPPKSMQVDPRMRRRIERIGVMSATSAQYVVRSTDGMELRL